MIVCECVWNDKHTNADRLTVYGMKKSDGNVIQVVANMTNVYEVGDRVNVALPGETVDGFLISETAVRGVLSQGMALGLAT